NRGDSIRVEVANPHREPVDGEVSIVTPLEAWGRALVGGHAILEVTPRMQAVRVPAGESVAVTFQVTGRRGGPADSYWAVAKLMSNGRIMLRLCGTATARRTQYDKPWLDSYQARAEQYGKTRTR
ncbi:MAG: hypothetical protein JXR94_18615, partial [Candidatus Hydrogenedentes bacterium]|nr:hypothetical protein [Candidatus Hydrogenedentota bacterium]